MKSGTISQGSQGLLPSLSRTVTPKKEAVEISSSALRRKISFSRQRSLNNTLSLKAGENRQQQQYTPSPNTRIASLAVHQAMIPKKRIIFVPRNYVSLAEAIEDKKKNIEISKLTGTYKKGRKLSGQSLVP